MKAQEVYPNAPLALVAAEVRYPYIPQVLERGEFLDLKQALGDHFPLAEEVMERSLTFSLGSQDAPLQTEQAQRRFASRGRTSAVTITPNNMIVETTDYAGYPSFRLLLEEALAGLVKVSRPDGLLRIGLRYIDEIRVPDIVDSPGIWDEYLHPALLSMAAWAAGVDGLKATTWQALAQLQHDSGTKLIVRSGPSFGHAVEPHGPTRRRRPPPPGPYFLIDIDSYWQADDNVPQFDLDQALVRFDQLHEPVRAIFEATITERLRDILRQKVD